MKKKQWCRPAQICRGAAFGSLVLIAGCAPTISSVAPPPAPVAPLRITPEPPPSLIGAYLQRARVMTAEELAAEMQRVTQQGGPRSQLLAAILLAAPNYPGRDDLRAQQIAEDIAQQSEHPVALRDSAALVAIWLDEQRRADNTQKRAQNKARDDELRIQQLEQRTRDLERRAQDAEKKLEALRAIEREMSNRGSTNGK